MKSQNVEVAAEMTRFLIAVSKQIPQESGHASLKSNKI